MKRVGKAGAWYAPYGCVLAMALVVCLAGGLIAAEKTNQPWVVYEGKAGPGVGKHIVFVTGDEEYRSEESMPMLAKILAVHHGFKCTVLWAINKTSGEIDPLTLEITLDSPDASLARTFLTYGQIPILPKPPW